MEEILPRWYSIAALANHWKVSRSTIYRFIKMGYLDATILGGRTVVTSSQAHDFMRKLEAGALVADNSEKNPKLHSISSDFGKSRPDAF